MQLGCPRCGHVLVYDGLRPRFCSHCGQPLSTQSGAPTVDAATLPPGDVPTIMYGTPAAAAAIPETIGGYRLVRPLGGGGMGSVYEAEETATGRRVALKLVRPEFADSPDTVERFRREGRLASTVLHPRCVFVIAADEAEGRPYIVMELMPGRNLHDLVEEKGPLSVQEAVAKVLDVIDGLQEAHRLGVVHRDVKPSNCFLDRDGRVKVGDFGLAKSLLGPQHLTKSGAFLGTLLFTAPEQIRNEQVNHLADVYSVCATLYYLLTGRAPFQEADAAATLARTVSDPLTPMRKWRPDLPRTLDEVVQRGMARPRPKRWQDLEELRLALLPFVEHRPQIGDIGWRVSAYLLDFLLVVPGELILQRCLALVGLDGARQGPVTMLFVAVLVSLAAGLCYFAVPEAVFGGTPGKWLMGLRVREVGTDDRPSWWRSALRTLWFYLVKDSATLLTALLLLVQGVRIAAEAGGPSAPRMVASVVAVALMPFLSACLGLAVLALPMRKRNGYRGLHELLSGTCVIRLPTARRHLELPRAPRVPEAALPDGVPARVGAFTVKGVARVGDDEMVLHGEDAALGRPIWLWLRRRGESAAVARREVARPTRPRWLAGGTQDGWTWDAFVATAGCGLTRRARWRRLGWLDTLGVLQQLTDELQAARKDGTLPASLSPEQVWVQATGAVQLLDVAPAKPTEAVTPFDLLRQTAAVALEGRPRSPGDLDRPIHAPVPGHAARLLGRLMGGHEPFWSLDEVKQALAAAHEHPEEVSRPGRALQVALTAATLGPGLLCMFALAPLLLLLVFVISIMGEALGQVAQERHELRLMALHADLVARPDVTGKVLLAAALEAEERGQHDLDEQLRWVQRTRETVMGSLTGFMRRRVRPVGDYFAQQFVKDVRLRSESGEPLVEDDTVAGLIDEWNADLSLTRKELVQAVGWVLLAVGAWPLLWCLWAAAARGGLGLWLVGIAVVDKTGRPAPRWRCAWRALLVWAPVVVLLSLSLWLELWRLTDAGAGRSGVVAWVAWASWWVALLLLPAYVWAAVVWPNRGLHDRLAGTYQVPR